MFDNVIKFFKKFVKNKEADSKETAKERLHLVLMQDRANVSADFLELMKQEIIDVIKKYIDVDETSIDVKLTNKANGDGTTGAPILYANIPIVSIKDENKSKVMNEGKKEETDKQEKSSKENELKQQEKSKGDKSEKEDTEKVEQNIEKSSEQKLEEKTSEKEDIKDDKQTEKQENVKQEQTEKQEENVDKEKIDNPKAEEKKE